MNSNGLMYDVSVAIIGAGPAGTACALALKKHGLTVALIDQASFPRDKICGDAIPGQAFKLMAKMNAGWAEAMRVFADESVIRSSTGFAPNGRSITMHWKTFSYNSKRLDFDHFLFRLVRSETDAIILENKRLEKIFKEGEKIFCHFQDGSAITAELVIGCDGAYSVVSRQLADQSPALPLSCAAVRAYYTGVKGAEKNMNEFHFLKGLMPGYFWIFPVGDNVVNVGFGMLHNRKKKIDKKLNLRQALKSIVEDSPELAPRFEAAQLMDKIKGFSLPIGTEKRKISGERFLLCGDAASLIDPLWGHGIDTAMWSGYLAAQQAMHCFQTGNFTAAFTRQYDKAVYQKYGKDFQRRTRLLQLLYRHPALINTFFKVGSHPLVQKWWS